MYLSLLFIWFFFRYGMLNLSNNDPGYYGKGIYFTQCPKYGEYYVEKLEEKTEGRFKLILCWALLGRPWAVTKVLTRDERKRGRAIS